MNREAEEYYTNHKTAIFTTIEDKVVIMSKTARAFVEGLEDDGFLIDKDHFQMDTDDLEVIKTCISRKDFKAKLNIGFINNDWFQDNERFVSVKDFVERKRKISGNLTHQKSKKSLSPLLKGCGKANRSSNFSHKVKLLCEPVVKIIHEIPLDSDIDSVIPEAQTREIELSEKADSYEDIADKYINIEHLRNPTIFMTRQQKKIYKSLWRKTIKNKPHFLDLKIFGLDK